MPASNTAAVSRDVAIGRRMNSLEGLIRYDGRRSSRRRYSAECLVEGLALDARHGDAQHARDGGGDLATRDRRQRPAVRDARAGGEEEGVVVGMARVVAVRAEVVRRGHD